MEDTLIEKKGNHITTITINRPKQLNALTPLMITELEQKFKIISEDTEVRAIIIRGQGNNFCAGVDVKGSSYNPLNSRVFLKSFNRMLKTIEMMPQPTIAMINGSAVSGGLELALACTFRIAAKNAKLGLPEIKLGLVAAGGATYRLPRLVGFGKAVEMCLLGDLMDGEKAGDCNLVNFVVSNEELADKTEALANRFVNNPPIAMSLVKDALYSASAPNVDNSALMEILSASVNHYTEDKKEGIEAFFSKRKPTFIGK
jgi:enoyl-CoA hydratase/carnithine racemase